MNGVELLVPAVVVFGWALGVQLAIWWPRTATAGSARGRAYSSLKYAAGGMSVGYLLLVLVLNGFVQQIEDLHWWLEVLAWGTLLQTPLAFVALAVGMGERVLATSSCLVAFLFVTGLAWFSFLIALALSSQGTPLQVALGFLATVLGGGAAASALELYVAVRQPRARWDESQADLL